MLKLPLQFESLLKFPSKRNKFNRRGTYISTSQTCDYAIIGIESSLNDTGIPSSPIPYVVNGTSSTPSTTIVVVVDLPILTPIHPMISTRPIVTNPFEYIFGTLGYNAQSIPSVSNPFYFCNPYMKSTNFILHPNE
jgi:hypothetical protein